MPVRTAPRRSQAPAQQEANSRRRSPPVCTAHPQLTGFRNPPEHSTAARISRQTDRTIREDACTNRSSPLASTCAVASLPFTLVSCPPAARLTVHLAAGLQRAEVGVSKRQLSCAKAWACACRARRYLSPVQARSHVHSPTSIAGAWCWHVLCKYGTQNPRTRARGASWESVGRSEVRAEGLGVMPQDCSNVSSTRGPRNDEALASSTPNCPF